MDIYFKKAVFRDGVEYLISDRLCTFSYDCVSFEIECNVAAASEIDRLCDRLRQGLAAQDIASAFADFGAHVPDIINAFDRYGFLTEGAPSDPAGVISGAAFWREIEAAAEREANRVGQTFFNALVEDRVSSGSLVRYALEYFHIVQAGPEIISGALAHTATPAAKTLLVDFLRSELGHDRMLLSSLEAVGLSENDVRARLPLRETFAIISGFQVWSDQEPLTFKALAFLLEEASAEFHEAFVSACRSRDLPETFYEPILRHADINDEGEHGAISRLFLEQVPVVSEEQRVNILKHLRYSIESLHALELAVLAEPVVLPS